MNEDSQLPPLNNGLMPYEPTLFGRGNLQVCRRGKKGNILIVSLHRPRVRNAFKYNLYLDLIDVLHLCAPSDSTVAAIVLTGTGSYFSSGADLKSDLATALDEAQNSLLGRQMLHKPAGRFMMALIDFPKILAAAVQGPAVGIGCTLLMHCDLVYMSSQATLWAPFTRLALVPELCSSQTFLRSMGLSKANELLLLGKQIDAQTALQWNIASQVFDHRELNTNEPFHPQSLAMKMANEIDDRLLSVPCGDRTVDYFVALVKGRRRQEMASICREELLKLDERFNSGQVMEAAQEVRFGSSARNEKAPRSKL
ncbi:hypothetical protein ACA910_021114 [Epithemia clementina (nom. ined.)]